MRYSEFAHVLNEDLSESLLRSLKSIISFLKSRIDSEDVEPKISSSLLITMMQNRGYDSFNFNDLLAAYNESPEVQTLISKPEKNSMLDILQGEEPYIPDQGTDLSAAAPQDKPAFPEELTAPEQGLDSIPAEPMNPDQEMPISSEPSGPIEQPQGTEQTVRSMAKKALKRRQ